METVLLGLHQGPAHKLCIEPGNPHIFYTCGEDGSVQRVSGSLYFLLYNRGRFYSNHVLFYSEKLFDRTNNK